MSKSNKAINSPKLLSLTIFLSKVVPKKVMMFLSNMFITLLLNTSYPGLQAIKSNLSVVYNKEIDEKEGKKLARKVLQNQAKYLYDVFHYYKQPEKIKRKIIISDEDRIKTQNYIEQDKGAILVGPHFGNFDICLIAIGFLGLDAQVLSVANPNADYKKQNQLRQVENLEITPISVSSLKAASRKLRNGGFVVTGVDRPIPENPERYRFFNKPGNLPDGHIRLAIQNKVPVVILHTEVMHDNYIVHISDPIYMEKKESKTESIKFNTEAVLKQLEKIIITDPLNWMMFFPIWE